MLDGGAGHLAGGVAVGGGEWHLLLSGRGGDVRQGGRMLDTGGLDGGLSGGGLCDGGRQGAGVGAGPEGGGPEGAG